MLNRPDENAASDIDTRKLVLTIFKDETGSVKKKDEFTLPEWRDNILNSHADSKDTLYWLKGIIFGNVKSKKGSYRTDANAKLLTAVVAEYDKPRNGVEKAITFDEAVAIIKKASLRALVYTSPSHKEAGKPRWRAIFPLSAHQDNPKDRHKVLVAEINGLFNGQIAPECFVLSQSYYFGSVNNNPDHRVEIVDGDFIDLRDDLFAGRVYKDGESANPFTNLDGEVQGGVHGLEAHLARMGDGPGLDGFHDVLLSATMSYAREYGAGLDREGLKAQLREAINEAPKDPTARPAGKIEYYLSDECLDALIESAIDKLDQPDDDEDEHDAGGHIILSEKNHVSRARKMRRIHRPNLQHYRDDFMDFDSGAYHVVADGVINAATWTFLDKAKAKRMVGRGKDAVLETLPFQPNQHSVSETIAALKAVAHLNPKLEPPCWLTGRSDLPAGALIAFPNGLLDLRNNTLHPLDANFFTTAALGFNYVAHAPKPANWLKFLDEIFAGDDKDEQIAALQEMFGYMMIPDTSLEKAFLLIGPKRSGKGTILAMLRKLLAPSSIAGPSLKSLGTNFGLAPLIGKQLAIIDDLRVGAPKDQDVLIENILKITGRGFFTIDRKFKSAWEGVLLLKLLLVSNLLPKLGDDSAALASRFISFETRISFYGREDPRLFEDKLLPELAGIFHWALEGLQRLRDRRRFEETSVSKDARERLANLGSLARAFIAEKCILDSKAHVEKRELYDKWVEYAKENNTYPGTLEKFCESLYAASEGVLRAGRPVETVKNVKGEPIKDDDGNETKRQINAVMGIKLKDWASNNFTNTDGEATPAGR